MVRPTGTGTNIHTLVGASLVLYQVDFDRPKSDIDKRNIVESLAGFSNAQLDAVSRILYGGLIEAQEARSAYLEKARRQIGPDSSPRELQSMWYENLRKEGLKLPEDIIEKVQLEGKIAPKLTGSESTSTGSLSTPYSHIDHRDTPKGPNTDTPKGTRTTRISSQIGNVTENSRVSNVGNDNSNSNGLGFYLPLSILLAFLLVSFLPKQ